LAVHFHPEAAKELESVVDWYANRSIRAATRFVEELFELRSGIIMHPHRGIPFEGNTSAFYSGDILTRLSTACFLTELKFSR
jgi:plasmid stabilization system protein ParE